MISVPTPDEAKPFLEQVCEKAGKCWSEVAAMVAARHAQLWKIDSVAVIATTVTDDGTCDIWLCGGASPRTWFSEAENVIGDFARRAGADRLRIIGRKGWRRVLPHWVEIGKDGELIVLELPL